MIKLYEGMSENRHTKVAMIVVLAMAAQGWGHYAYYVVEEPDLVITDSKVFEVQSEIMCAVRCVIEACSSVGFETGGSFHHRLKGL